MLFKQDLSTEIFEKNINKDQKNYMKKKNIRNGPPVGTDIFIMIITPTSDNRICIRPMPLDSRGRDIKEMDQVGLKQILAYLRSDWTRP